MGISNDTFIRLSQEAKICPRWIRNFTRAENNRHLQKIMISKNDKRLKTTFCACNDLIPLAKSLVSSTGWHLLVFPRDPRFQSPLPIVTIKNDLIPFVLFLQKMKML